MANRFRIDTIFRGIDNFTAPIRRMARSVGTFSIGAARALGRVSRSVSGLVSGIGRAGLSIAKLGLFGVAGFGASIVVLNQATTQLDALAKSVGVSTSMLTELGEASASAGFNVENIVDLVEEMNNKLGESAGLAEIAPVTEALQILKLRYSDIKKLAPEQQFKKIADAALKMADGQKAASALDMLLGGEASKIIGVWREQGKTIDEVMGKYRALNFLTKRGSDGAKKFSEQWRGIVQSLGTMSSELAGLAGEALAPMIKQALAWAAANKGTIQKNLIKFIDYLSGGIKTLIKDVKKFVDESGGIKEAIKIIYDKATKFITLIKENGPTVLFWAKTIGILIGSLWALGAVLTVVNLLMTANPVGLVIVAIAALASGITALIVNADKIDVWLSGLPDLARAALAPFRALVKVIKFAKENSGKVADFFGVSSDEGATSSPSVTGQQQRIADQSALMSSTKNDLRVTLDKGLRGDISGDKSSPITLMRTGL